MPTINYIEHDGTCHEVHAEAGWSVMEGAIKNGVPGIDADCGGACACATCHVRIAVEWREATGERSGMEQEMLEFFENVTANSRLACQIRIDDALDGLTVHIPENQY